MDKRINMLIFSGEYDKALAALLLANAAREMQVDVTMFFAFWGLFLVRDPNKISGRCGRLKCCLRYENDTYEELAAELPPAGSEIVTPHGRARVLNLEILSQQLLISTEDNRRLLIPAAECLTILKRGQEI